MQASCCVLSPSEAGARYWRAAVVVSHQLIALADEDAEMYEDEGYVEGEDEDYEDGELLAALCSGRAAID